MLLLWHKKKRPEISKALFEFISMLILVTLLLQSQHQLQNHLLFLMPDLH